MISFEVFDKSTDFYFAGLVISAISCLLYEAYKHFREKSKKVEGKNE